MLEVFCELMKRDNSVYAIYQDQEIPVVQHITFEDNKQYWAYGKIKQLPFGKRFYINSLLSTVEATPLGDYPFMVS